MMDSDGEPVDSWKKLDRFLVKDEPLYISGKEAKTAKLKAKIEANVDKKGKS